MGVIEDLEKLNNLKEQGVITEEEFKNQKSKILNSNKKSIKKISPICFIVVGIGIFLFILCISLFKYHDDKSQDIVSNWDSSHYYEERPQYILKESNQEYKNGELYKNISITTGCISGVFLVVGIVFKIKEIKQIKNFNG